MRLPLFILVSLCFFYAPAQTSSERQTAADYNALAWNLRNSNPEQAKEYGLSAIAVAEKSGSKEELIKAYSFTGVAYRNLGYYEEALRHYSKGLDLALKVDNKKQQCYAYINIANLHIYLDKPQKAQEQLETIAETVLALNDLNISGYYHLNLGRVWMMLQRYAEAEKELLKSLAVRLASKNANGQGVCRKYLGDLYLLIDNTDKAVVSYQEALTLVDGARDKDLFSSTLNGLALAELRSGNINSSENNALNALMIAGELNSLLRLKEASHTLAEIYKQYEDYEKSEYYLNQVITYTDQIYTDDLQKQADQFAYVLRNKELEHEKATLIIEHEKRNQKVLIISVSGLLLLSFIAFILFQKKKIAAKNQRLENISEQNQKLEERVTSRTAELHEKTRKLEELSKFKESLTQMIAHDLVNQLGIVLQASDFQTIEQNHKIKKSTLVMYNMVNNMLDIQKFEDATISLDLRSVSLSEVLSNVLDQLQLLIDNKKLDISKTVDLEIKVICDEKMISRVLTNLLSNAIKHSPINSSIHITAELSQKRVIIGIRDQGNGIAKEDLPFVFDKYWQKKIETGDPFGTSSGIGLAFCRLAVEAHNGAITVASEIGKGTTFRFDLSTQVENISNQPELENEINLEESEKEKLRALANQLRSTPIYQISTIKELLNSACISAPGYELWSKEVMTACYGHDQKYLLELLSKV